MHRLWKRIRMPLAIVFLLIITLAMARLFSGPEDTWIKNEHGEWIKHGNPSAPAPTQDYREPIAYKIIPVIFFVTFALPIFLIGKYKLQYRFNFDTATRDIKFLGYLSTALFLSGILIGFGLIIEIGLAENSTMSETVVQDFLFFISLEGLAGLCIVIGIQFFMLKRNCNDHYQIERSRREIIEILENLRSDR